MCAICVFQIGDHSLPLHKVAGSKANGHEDYHADIWCAPQQGKSPTKSFVDEKMTTIFRINPLDVRNHERIVEEFGIKNYYDKHLGLMNADTPALKYYVLVYCMQLKKLSGHLCFGWSQIEGNNRAGAMIHLLLSSCYDAQEGSVRYGSLTKEWIADNMAKSDDMRERYLLNLKNDKRSIKDMLRETINNEKSMINKTIQIVVWHGKSRAEFAASKTTAEEALSVLRTISRTISRAKTNSSTPFESVEISDGLANIHSLLMESSRKLEEGEIPGFSQGADRYVEFDPEGMEEPLPPGAPENLKRTVNKNRVCAIFESQEWTNFSTNPTSVNMKKFVDAWQAGVVKINVDTSKNAPHLVVVQSKRVPGPFFLSDHTLGDVQGDRKKSTTMPKSSGKNRQPVLSEKHTPLGCEEMNKIIFLTVVWIPLYRAKKGIPLNCWEDHSEKDKCMLELQFIIESQICTSFADKIEPTKNISKKYKQQLKGDKEDMTPISEERTHWAAALFLVECMISIVSNIESREDALARMNGFIDAVYRTSKDTASYKDYDWIGDLGMFHSCEV